MKQAAIHRASGLDAESFSPDAKEGTVAGLPFGTPNREDDFVGGGQASQVSPEWTNMLIGGLWSAKLTGSDTTAGALEGLIGDIAKEIGLAAAKRTVDLVFG